MKTAVAGDKRVSRLAGKQRVPSEETGLVASRYALRYTAPSGKCFLWNELTRSLLLPETPEEQAFLDYFEDIGASEPLPRRRIPEELVKTATASFLFEEYFLVGEKTEETKRYREIFDTLRLLDKKPKGLRNYTILTTTRCNARCAYCYEAGVLQEPMTPETAEAVAEFILRTRDPEAETLRFMWFGGEPLMGQEVMDIITGRLNQEKVPFISTVITNGYLADDEVVKKAIGPWHVRNVQVTLDGTEEKYNRVKDYIDCEGSAFVRVLSNVRRLCEAKIPLYIRINAAPGDLEDAYRLADYLKAEFGVGFLAGVYVNNLFMAGEEPIPYGEPPQSVQTYLEEVETLQKTIRSEGLQDPEWLENKMDEPMAGFKTSLCRASSMASALVINQAGRLTNCQHCLPGDFFGDVWKGIVKDENWSRINRPPVKEACQDCPMLPSCTNQSAYCPNLLRWCGWDMRRRLRLALDRLWEKEKGWEA